MKATEAGCDGVVSNAVKPDAIGLVKAANQQGWNETTFLFLTSVYSESFAKAVSNSGAGVYVPAEFYPFTEGSEVNTDRQQLLTENKIPPTSLTQGGYLAATFFVAALESISSDVTRESVNTALAQLPPIENPMIAFPYQFDTVASGDFQPDAWPVVLKSNTNAWQKAADDWLMVPKQ